MAGVLVSYRRDDSQGFAGLLVDDLKEILGNDRVFRDVEISSDNDCSDVLHRAIAACDALVVVVGRQWAAQSDDGHGSRLFEPTDWIRTQIEAAFAQGKVVVPVLVGGADMPERGALPKSIARLASYHADSLTDREWKIGVAELVDHLVDLCPSLVAERVRGAAVETPLDVLGESGEGFFEKIRLRKQREMQPPNPPRRLRRILLRILQVMAGLLLLLILAYLGIRWSGGI